MAELNVYDLKAKKVSTVTLNDEVFAIEPNTQAIYDAVLRQQASLRQGTHDTKTRSEVSGGGKKPFRQAGTGRARQGSSKANLYRGGGIAFGPTPRKYIFKLNRKVRKLAIKSALSLKTREENLIVVNDMKLESPKTKGFTAILDAFKIDRKVLVVVDAAEDIDNAYLASRNLGNVKLVTVEGMNIFDLVNASKLMMTLTAANKTSEVFGNE